MTSAPRVRDEEVIRRLSRICGEQFARPACAADEVAGTPARWVAAPGTAEAMGEVLRMAAGEGFSVVPRGAGTKIDWGAPPPHVDMVLDTGRVAGVWHERDARPTVEVGAGTPFRAAQAMLERTGRRLVLDAPSPGATVGGILAADEAGPLRHRHGSPADQVVGVRYVDATGRLTRAEVAATDSAPGEELIRSLCGSHGALGVLVSATLRVQQIPARQLWVSRSVWTPLEVHDLVGEILAAGLFPAAIEVDLPATIGAPLRRRSRPAGSAMHPAGTGLLAGSSRTGSPSGCLSVLLEGGPAETTERAARLVSLLRGDATPLSVAPPWWRTYPFRPDDVALRIDVPIRHLHAAVYALRDAAGTPLPVRGSAGLGVVHAALPGASSAEQVANILAAVRAVLLARSGSCVVVSAPPHIRAAVDIWGELPDLSLSRQLKQRYDPAGRLAPGRFVGGI